MALVTVEDVAGRIDWEMDEYERSIAQNAIDDLEAEARYYGLSTWTEPTNTPDIVCRTIAKAAARHLKNHMGLTTSRAGDETQGWSDRDANEMRDATFTDAEIRLLRSLAGGYSNFGSIEATAWRSTYQQFDYGVPVAGGGKPFPWPREGDRL